MTFHANKYVNSILANFIFQIIDKESKLVKINSCPVYIDRREDNISVNLSVDLARILSKGFMYRYVKYLKKHMQACGNGDLIGSVILTANPLTNGHVYLVNEAKKQCDLLYVFIVEENEFMFSTVERMKLAKQVLEDEKTIVLTTGSMMTAKYTFPEYYIKSHSMVCSTKLNVSPLHFVIFGNVVAPTLGITKRFLGEEMEGTITDCYNKKTLMILPSFGINVDIVRRLRNTEGLPISASEVRKLIAEKNFVRLRDAVPSVVFDYIKQKYDRG